MLVKTEITLREKEPRENESEITKFQTKVGGSFGRFLKSVQLATKW